MLSSTLIKQQLLYGKRRASLWLTPLLFFVIAVSFFPLTLTANDAKLTSIAPGVIWVVSLFASLLSLQWFYRDDCEDGSLDQLILSPQPLPVLILNKTIGHWMLHGLPIVLLAPLMGMFYHLNLQSDLLLMLTLLIGTPILMFLGAIGCALTIGLKGHGFLLPVLIFPLFIPIIMLATTAIKVQNIGLPVNGYLALLMTALLMSAVVSPFVSAAALKMGVSV